MSICSRILIAIGQDLSVQLAYTYANFIPSDRFACHTISHWTIGDGAHTNIGGRTHVNMLTKFDGDWMIFTSLTIKINLC